MANGGATAASRAKPPGASATIIRSRPKAVGVTGSSASATASIRRPARCAGSCTEHSLENATEPESICVSRGEPAYVELQVTTHFSFLRGASSPDELFAAAALPGLPALGVVDRHRVAGIVRAGDAGKATGVGAKTGRAPGRERVGQD